MSTDRSEEPGDEIDNSDDNAGDKIDGFGEEMDKSIGEIYAVGEGSPSNGYSDDLGQSWGHDEGGREEEGHEEGGREEGGCGRAVPAWLIGLHPMLPETLFVPYHPGRARFCFRKLGKSEDCGLVCFSAPEVGEPYRAAFLACHGFAELRRLSLDEACDLARGSSVRVNCVALIDDPFHPVIQAVC